MCCIYYSGFGKRYFNMTMKLIEYDFRPYVILNEEYEDIGIRDDAPEEAKKAYADFHAEDYDENGNLLM